MPRIGLFGGTFDPPHLGHLILAGEALAQLELARLLWVLTPTPPHKLDQQITPLEHRLAMLERAIGPDPSFELSRLEVDRPGPHYTLDTVEQIRTTDPSAEVILVIGSDSLRDLPDWHRAPELVSACSEIGVMRRPSTSSGQVPSSTLGQSLGEPLDLSELERALPGIGVRVRFVDAPLLEIASSDIRQRAARGGPFRYYVPPPVYEYILEHGLYKNSR